MKRSVEITTPIPTAEMVAERLGVSKTRQRKLRNIVERHFRVRRRDAQPGALRHRHTDTAAKGRRK